jgi:hypothetical protein
MEYKALYKGSQYVAVWIILYLIVKYILGTEVSEVDAALTASVLTLLLLITENMMYLRNDTQNFVRDQIEKDNVAGFNRNNLERFGGLTGSLSSADLTAAGVNDSLNSFETQLESKPGLVYQKCLDEKTKLESEVAGLTDNNSNKERMKSKLKGMTDLCSKVKLQLEAKLNAVTADLRTIDISSSGLNAVNASQISSDLDSSDLDSSDLDSSDLSNSSDIPLALPSVSGSDLSSDLSSDSSLDSSLDGPNPSAGSVNESDATKVVEISDNEQDPSMKINSIDLPGSAYDQKGENTGNDVIYAKSDYYGNQSLFDRTDFGGTNNKPVVFNNNKEFGIAHNDPDRTNVVSSNSGANNVIMMPHTVDTNGSSESNFKIDMSKLSGTKPVNSSYTKYDPSIAIIDPTKHKSDWNELGVKWYEQKFDPRDYSGAENLDQIAVSGGRTRNDLLVNNYKYSDFNRMPPSFNKGQDFEYGYSYLPPSNWYPLPPYPPVCVTSTSCPVQPVFTDRTTMDLKEWRDTQKITPPDAINTEYIKNEMNSKA